MRNKIIDEKELENLAQTLRNENKTVVATCGCFDIIHAGHITYLSEAKKYADVLVVFLNSDESVKQLKGPNRPIVPENERKVVLSGLESVDYVCVFNDINPCKVLAILKPDVFVKGGDYKDKQIPEETVLAEFGGRIEYLSFVDGCSTTNIIKRIEDLL